MIPPAPPIFCSHKYPNATQKAGPSPDAISMIASGAEPASHSDLARLPTAAIYRSRTTNSRRLFALGLAAANQDSRTTEQGNRTHNQQTSHTGRTGVSQGALRRTTLAVSLRRAG